MEERIGRYEIQAELGRGAFGRVYRAYDPSMAGLVAVKVLAAVGEPDAMTRFRQEAGMTRRLQHKNIVTIYESGEQNGCPYIVMELLEGENLQTILKSKRSLSLLEKTRIMCQIAEGLNYAHQCGVIHRDVKPANIMLLPSGIVKIMDFGIARLVHTSGSRQTRTGYLVGTTSYMSPEQFRGDQADAQSDVFAFGVIAYELLSGVHPFEGGDESGVMYRIMTVDPLPLNEVAPDCPEPLQALVQRSLAKDRALRYPSLEDVLFDADPILLDLRRDQSAQLMVTVKKLITDGEFDSANAKLRQALELDPVNREARQVRETLNQERTRRLLEENTQALVRDGAAKLASRQFTDAFQTFEAALRLKPDDQKLQTLVADAKAKMLANREAGRLLSEAKRETHGERFAEARSLAARALESDPGHQEAPGLIRFLDETIIRMEGVARLKTGVDEAEELFRAGNYPAALAKLDALESAFPGSQPIGELQKKIRARQTEEYRRERLERLESGLADIRHAQREGKLSEGLANLQVLRVEFPGVSAIENLTSAITEELASEQRAHAVEKLAEEVRAFLWAKRTAEAFSLLEDGRNRFPADAGLDRLLDAVRAVSADCERLQRVTETAAEANRLRRAGHLEEALELVKAGIRSQGADTVLSDLNRILGLQVEDRRACERLERYKTESQSLLSSSSAGEALGLLREARAQYPTDPSLELLLATAEESYARQNEQEVVDSVLKSVAHRQELHDFSGALEEIEKGLRRYPAAHDLLRAEAALRESVLNAEREKKLDRLLAEARGAIDREEWTRAQTLVSSAQREYPDKFAIDELAAQIQSRQRASEAARALAGVKELLRNGNLEGAAEALAGLEPAYGGDEIWKAEKRELESRQVYQADLRTAEELRKKGNYVEAEAMLRKLMVESPLDSRAAILLKVVNAELQFKTREEQVRTRLIEAAALFSKASYPEAISILTGLQQQFPNEKKVSDALEKARAALGVSLPANRTVSAKTPLPDREPTAIACASCRAILPPHARFCDNCGKPLAPAAVR